MKKLTTYVIWFALCFVATKACASTLYTSGTFSNAVGNLFSVGEPYSATIDYDPATAAFVGGTGALAQYTQSANLSIVAGPSIYVFPLWEFFVQDNGIHQTIQFIAADFNTFLLIGDLPEQSALVPPLPQTLAGRSGETHIWLSDQSQASGVGTIGVTPIPSAAFCFVTGLGAFGLLGWRRKKKASTSAV